MDVIPRIRAAPTRDFYLAYLNSPAWRTVRTRALERADYRCYHCGAKRDLQVHHLSYDRLGAERDDDLQVVCADCHEAVHLEAFAQSDGLYLKLAREALRADPLASLSDLAEDVKRLCATRRIPYLSGRLTRALRLVTGQAITRVDRWPRRDGPPTPTVFTRQEAHEFLCRSELVGAVYGRVVRSMPDVLYAKSPAEQAAHEARIRDQVQAFKAEAACVPRRRQPIRERLEAIFAGQEP